MMNRIIPMDMQNLANVVEDLRRSLRFYTRFERGTQALRALLESEMTVLQTLVNAAEERYRGDPEVQRRVIDGWDDSMPTKPAKGERADRRTFEGVVGPSDGNTAILVDEKKVYFNDMIHGLRGRRVRVIVLALDEKELNT